MQRLIYFVFTLLFVQGVQASDQNVEEQRVPKAAEAMPSVVQGSWTNAKKLRFLWSRTWNYEHAKNHVHEMGSWFWEQAKKEIHKTGDYDDRPLYWARLQFSAILRTDNPSFDITDSQRLALLELLEETSRGRHDLEFVTNVPLKILITGFDPFLLDRNIEQGNPSGIAALLLDGQVIEYQGRRAEINSVIFPVRYEDFDQGEVETLLAPYYALNSVDMVVTISQGRTDFDLERFPGRRRSSAAPDNLNVFSGGSFEKPLISDVGRYGLTGPEFVEFSLPVEQMQQASGKYKVNDNRKVFTLEKGSIQAKSLQELSAATAVEGGGGGYLSNEISYRSIRLRNMLGSQIPTGHIHTPVLKEASPEQARPIFEQIKAMLERALPAL